jgi:hypothetical protein
LTVIRALCFFFLFRKFYTLHFHWLILFFVVAPSLQSGTIVVQDVAEFDRNSATTEGVSYSYDSSSCPENRRSQIFQEKFDDSTKNFDKKCKEMSHKVCHSCKIVSLQDIFKTDNLCHSCASSNSWSVNFLNCLPLWSEVQDGKIVQHFKVPEVLSCLREGEKLLIQQISVYVPLHHLMYGQLGARGHIVSFPQDISSVCHILPRLPSQVSLIRVVKHFKLDDGEIGSKSFSVRKEYVINALEWLKLYNRFYKDITIRKSNLDWIEDGKEQQLAPSINEVSIDENLMYSGSEDRGPSEEQIANITDANVDMEPCYGNLRDFNPHLPKAKDSETVESIIAAEQAGKAIAAKSTSTIDFPFVSPDPVSEYTEQYLFEKAFPWLFPGGCGGYDSMKNPKPTLAEWMRKTILYEDGRFSRDKMWSFCALNYFARQSNQKSGSFFVQSFFKQGPKTLEELQDQVSSGNMSWINSISYFSSRVTGSSSYWRARRNEVFSWINYHLEQKHGPPSFFITLSCAEYHWQDIERLIADRCEKAFMPVPDFSKGRTTIINDHSIVVQEYFQNRVEAWLASVGKDLLLIKHHWLRYEFAPSRGQIHAHMLAICDNSDMLRECHRLQTDKEQLAVFLSSWLGDTLGMTAQLNSEVLTDDNSLSAENHPSVLNYTDILPSETVIDTARCQVRFQKHKCSAYCMRKRSKTMKDESPESKQRRVCRCGSGVEATFMHCDTPGFKLRETPEVVRDMRGFDRVDLPRNNRNITQSSSFLMRGWRGNCDIQPLLYTCSPDDVSPSDVCRVTNYIVCYCCKGNEAVVEEKKSMASIVNATKEEEGDDRDVKRLARRLLNDCSKSRIISKQESICQLAGLNLYTCSEALEPTSLAGYTRLGKDNEGKKTFLVKYASRDECFDMSLDQYFHYCFNQNPQMNRGDKRFKIPIYSGAQCEAVYPATQAYARAVMMIYSPWRATFSLEADHLLEEFSKFVSDSSRCPQSVIISYERARLAIGMKEPTSSLNNFDYDTFAVRPDSEVEDLVGVVSTLYNQYSESNDEDSEKYDYGLERNWNEPTVQVSKFSLCKIFLFGIFYITVILQRLSLIF